MNILGIVASSGIKNTGPAPACSITLSGDIAALFDGEPLDISGQTVSKTVPESPANAYAAGIYPDIISLNWTGRRAIAKKASVFDTSGMATFLLVNPTVTKFLQLTFAGSAWVVVDSSENQAFIAAGTGLEKAAFVIDGDSGDVEAWVNGVGVTKNEAPWMASFFAGETAIYLADAFVDATEGDTYEAQFYTSAEGLADVGFPADTFDWCGNVIPEQPVELYSYPLNASEALISTLTSTSGNYGKLTPSDDEQTGSVILDVGLTTNDKALLGNLSAEVPAPEFVFLNDMSIGQGAFGFEVHVTFPKTNAPLESPLGFAGVQLRDSVNPNKFFQIGGFTGSSGLPVSGETSVNSVVLYDDGGVKRFSLWGNGVAIISGANLADFSSTAGLDLSALFVFMYIQAGVNPADANKFVDENPTISCRFVTNPAEMVYGPSVFPAGTKTIVKDGIIVPPGPPLPTMIAGYRSWMNGEELIELSGYVDGLLGSFYGNPLDGFGALYVGIRDGIILGGVAEFRGDVSAALAGKSLYLDGVEYPITEVSLSSLGNTSAGIPTLPAFVEGVIYTVEFR